MNILDELLNKAMFRIAVKLQNELKLKCPVDTGRARNSIKVRPIKDNEGLSIFVVDYVKFVEFGSNPHVIRPKNKKALKFKGDQSDVITKLVNHPGTRPNPFIRTAIKTKLPGIVREELSKL